MANQYSNSSPVNKGYIMASKTDQDSREAYHGERFQPIIHMADDRFTAAPYLPFTPDFVKEWETYTVIRRHKLVSTDEQGYVVPANGIIVHDDATTPYHGRPLVYTGRDVADGSAYGDFAVDNHPVNLNAETGAALVSGDVNAQGVVTMSAGNGAAELNGMAGRGFAAVSAARMPIGVVTDKVLSRAGRYQYREMDPQATLTILAHRVILFAERTAHRRNYAQASFAAVAAQNSLVGAGTVVGLADLTVTATWAAAGSDVILAGDLVTADDAGDFSRLNTIPTDFTAADVSALIPVEVMHSVVGRCSGREEVVGDIAMALVKTYRDSTDVGGNGTAGVEKILTRGDAVTGAEVTAIQAKVNTPSTFVNKEWDIKEDAKYGLLIHFNML